jgi:hypothetical protein
LGYRLTLRFSLGLEGGALGNEEYDAGRGGGFARVNLRAMEVTLCGGFTGNYLEDDPAATSRSGSIGRSRFRDATGG